MFASPSSCTVSVLLNGAYLPRRLTPRLTEQLNGVRVAVGVAAPPHAGALRASVVPGNTEN